MSSINLRTGTPAGRPSYSPASSPSPRPAETRAGTSLPARRDEFVPPATTRAAAAQSSVLDQKSGAGLFSFIGDAAKAVGGAIGGAAKAVGGAVGDAAKAVGSAVGSAAKTVGNAVGDAAKWVGNAAGKVGGVLKDALPWASTIASFIPGLNVVAIPLRIATAVTGAIDAIKNGNWLGALGSVAASAAGAAGAFGARGLANVANLISKGAGTAQNLMESIKSGRPSGILSSLASTLGFGAEAVSDRSASLANSLNAWAERASQWGNIAGSAESGISAIQNGDWLGAVDGFSNGIGGAATQLGAPGVAQWANRIDAGAHQVSDVLRRAEDILQTVERGL